MILVSIACLQDEELVIRLINNIFTGLEKLHRLTAADYIDWILFVEVVKDKEDGTGAYTFVTIPFNF